MNKAQDWGIINADGQRLHEFIAIYDSLKLSKEMKYQMFELIIASANEALGDEQALDDEQTKTGILDFVRRSGRDFPEQLSYWARLEDEEEFPVAAILRKIL